MLAQITPWLIAIVAAGAGAFAVYKWGMSKQKTKDAIIDAKAFKKVAQDQADTPGTDDDFHKRMHGRIDGKR